MNETFVYQCADVLLHSFPAHPYRLTDGGMAGIALAASRTFLILEVGVYQQITSLETKLKHIVGQREQGIEHLASEPFLLCGLRIKGIVSRPLHILFWIRHSAWENLCPWLSTWIRPAQTSTHRCVYTVFRIGQLTYPNISAPNISGTAHSGMAVLTLSWTVLIQKYIRKSRQRSAKNPREIWSRVSSPATESDLPS